MDSRLNKALIKKDKKYIWHPFTQMADWVKDEPSAPLVIARGRGNYLYDIKGAKYLDGVSSLWVTLHGHGKKEINEAIKKQLSKVAHTTFLGLTHEPAITLAEKLVNIAPKGLSRVFYSDNGSTAAEVALKIAYQYWLQKGYSKKTRFLSFVNAYHGDTIGSVSVGGMDLFHAKFKSMLFDAFHAPSPYCFRCKFQISNFKSQIENVKGFKSHCVAMNCKGQCLKETETILKKHHNEIAAAIIEPLVQGAAGMLTMPPGFLKGIETLCRRYNVLLICDEVATGFGRTGKMFAVEHENVKPDLLCIAKGITGGYLPLAATLVSEKVYGSFLGRFEEFKTFFHGHTYTANPLGCAAAIANLELFKKEKVLKRLPEKIKHMERELSKLWDIECVGDIRQIGLMAGIELVKNRETKEDFPAKLKIGARVCAAARPHGLLIRPLGNVIVFMPPLSVTKKEITFMADTLRKALSETI